MIRLKGNEMRDRLNAMLAACENPSQSDEEKKMNKKATDKNA